MKAKRKAKARHTGIWIRIDEYDLETLRKAGLAPISKPAKEAK